MKKQFVKVVGTFLSKENGQIKTSFARGIQPLEQKQTLFEYATQFIEDRNLPAVIYQRHLGFSAVIQTEEDSTESVSYHFVQFEADDLGFHAKDLSEEELERDLKQLRRYIK